MNDLFTYPNAPGYQDTDTSRIAAAEMVKPAGTIRAKVLDILKQRGGLATFEIAGLIGVSYRSTQPRTSELRAKGSIRDSGGRKRDPETGKLAIVWEVGQ